MIERKKSMKRMAAEPPDIDAGYLEVSHDENFQVIVNLPKLDTDAEGLSWMAFSPRQARGLAKLLMKHSIAALHEYRLAQGGRQDAAAGKDS